MLAPVLVLVRSRVVEWPPLPGRLPSLPQCLVLALLLHLLAVALLGSVPGGSARPGEGVWGRIDVRLAGDGPPGTPAPAAAPVPETGPPGTAATPRFGGAVRTERDARVPAERPGAATLGRWSEVPVPPALEPTPSPSTAAEPSLRPAPEPAPLLTAPDPAPVLRTLDPASALPPPASVAPLPALARPAARLPDAPPAERPALPELAAPAPRLRQLAAPDAAREAPRPSAPLPAAPAPLPPTPALATAVPELAPLPAAPAPAARPAPATVQAPPAPAPAPATAAPVPPATATPATAPTPAPTTTPVTATSTPPSAPSPSAPTAPAAPMAATTPAPPGAGASPPAAAPRATAGAPDAGTALGHDMATPPSAPASAPRLNLDLPRPRGGLLAGQGTRGVLQVVPLPPERKDKLADEIQKAAREDCRRAYSGMGLLAAVPLARDALRGDGCKW